MAGLVPAILLSIGAIWSKRKPGASPGCNWFRRDSTGRCRIASWRQARVASLVLRTHHRVVALVAEIDGVGRKAGTSERFLLVDGDLHLAAVGADIGAIDMIRQQRRVGIEPAALDPAAEQHIGVDRPRCRDRHSAPRRGRQGARALARCAAQRGATGIRAAASRRECHRYA